MATEKNQGATAPEITPEELLLLHKSQNELLEKQAAQIEELKREAAETAELRKRLEEATAANAAAVVGAPIVTIRKKKYKVVHGVQTMVAGVMKKVTAAEIAANADMAEGLLDLGSTAIVAI